MNLTLRCNSFTLGADLRTLFTLRHEQKHSTMHHFPQKIHPKTRQKAAWRQALGLEADWPRTPPITTLGLAETKTSRSSTFKSIFCATK